MKKRNLFIIVTSFVSITVIVFFSAFIYSEARFNPNDYSNIKRFMNQTIVETFTKYFTPQLYSLDIDFLDDSGLFQNNYKVLLQRKVHDPRTDGFYQPEVYVGDCKNGKFDDVTPRLVSKNLVMQSWFENVSEERAAELRDSKEGGINYYAYFTVNSEMRLDYLCYELKKALTGDGDGSEEIEWAGKAFPGTDFMYGTPLGALNVWEYTYEMLDPWRYGKFLEGNMNDPLLKWYLDSGMFGDFSSADFEALLVTPFTMDAVMIFGKRDTLLKYRNNPLVTLAKINVYS